MANSVIDLFCGVGGMTHGFILEGFNVVAGIDSDETCQYAYEHNNTGATFMHRGVEDLTAAELLALYPERDTKILIGCAPCQMYSKYATKYEKDLKRTPEDKWTLLRAFADIIDGVDPDIVSMENVSDLMTYDDGRVFTSFTKRLKLQYEISTVVVNCPDYGIPQNRKRLVLLASKRSKIKLLEKTHTIENRRTVRDVIGHLPSLGVGQVDANDPLHRVAGLSELNMRRIQHSLPGGTWRDWPAELRAECHTRETGQSYSGVYGRMSWDEPSPTITTQAYGYGNGRFGHPEQDRAISMREAALLQTFPADYDFVSPEEQWSFSNIGKRIGNAVPVDLGRVIARSIKQHLENDND